MKRLCVVVSLLSICAFASCGGGSSAPAPQPTSTETKAASATGVMITTESAAQGAQAGLIAFSGLAMAIGGKTATPYTGTFDFTCPGDNHCSESLCQNGGSLTVSGTATANCTITASDWSCTSFNAPMTITFNACQMSVTTGGTAYAETIDGSVTATFTGSIAGTGMGAGGAFTSVDFTGTMAGTATLAGDVAGTVKLDNTTFGGSGVPEPTVTCSGTTDVTIGGTTQVCTVATDCSGCTE